MMQVLLCALAAMLVQVNAQTAMITNCTSYPGYRQNGHTNVPASDCLHFYSCDNFDQGKLQTCAEGTQFNSALGSCTENSCPQFIRDACATSSGILNVPSVCCLSYYEVHCDRIGGSTGYFVYKMCPSNQIFDPLARSCVNGNTMCANTTCGSQTSAGGCAGSLLNVINDCTFTLGNTTNIMRCPTGTKVDPTTCRCDKADPSGDCANSFECSSWFLNAGTDFPNATRIYPDEYNSAELGRYRMSFFKGNGLPAGTTTQNINLVVSVVPNFGSTMVIMGQPCTTLPGMSFQLRLSRNNQQFTAVFAVTDEAGQAVESTTSQALFVTSTTSASTFEFNIRIGPSPTVGKRSCSGTFRVNGGSAVNFNTVEFTQQWWAALKNCALTVGDSGDGQFKNNGGRVISFTYNQCKK